MRASRSVSPVTGQVCWRSRRVGAILLLFVIVAQLTSTFSETKIYRDDICGAKQFTIDSRIAGGYLAEDGDWPWHGALSHKAKYQCGCSLISKWFVLTAGHCLFNPETSVKFHFKDLRVALGLLVLKRRKSHTLLKKIHPIKIYDSKPPFIEKVAGNYGTVVGWGFTEEAKVSNQLQTAQMLITRYADCVESNPDLFGRFIHNGMYCAEASNGTNVCNGDSDGGMYIFQNNSWHLLGAISFAALQDRTNLCDLYSYAGFTHVPHYLSWIESQLRDHERHPYNVLRQFRLRSGLHQTVFMSYHGTSRNLFRDGHSVVNM